jgi:Calpain family cysteine protease
MPDGGLQTLAAADFARDGSITYSDMVGLLNQAISEATSAGQVTTAIYDSLQALVSGASVLNESPIVQDLATELLSNDPSNAYFQGTTPLGELAVGSSAAQLQMLTEKWFLGEDHPTIDTNYSGSSGCVYAPASGTLFNSTGLPSYEDVYQGEEGDCWLLTSFAVTANNPQGQSIIQSQFTYEGTIGMDGAEVWAVRFYNNGVAQYVTVDNYLPVQYGTFMYADMGQDYTSSSNVLWVALDEKAYAQLSASGWNSRPESDSYASLDGGLAETALPVITGGSYASTDPLSSQAALISAINAGTLISMGSNNGSETLGIAPDHDYGVLSYNSSTGLFTILNPWGWNTDYSDGSYNCPGLLYLTYNQIISVYSLDGNDVTSVAGADGSAADVLASSVLAVNHAKSPSNLAASPSSSHGAQTHDASTPCLAAKLSGMQASSAVHPAASNLDLDYPVSSF